ncbi:MAG TPA: glycerophosphodiester phosphodiesterase family protein [Terricaulis sp.]|nr:glycerophosphodiester phosphodiesterase family protein [Terricaulis sp.]
MRAALFIAAALALTACEAAVVGVEGRHAPPADTLTPASLPGFFDCLRDRGEAVVSAHRGGPAPGFAENAIPTFENTVRAAPAFLEVDIARTRDGALILMHDDTLERTTTGEGAVRDLTLAQIQSFSLRDDNGRTLSARPPTLREALDWANGRAILELDVKRGVSYEDVAREVEAAGAMGRVVFITYSVDGAARLARVAPGAMIYTTIERVGDIATLERRGVDLSRIVAWIGTGAPDAALIDALNARGIEARIGVFGSNRNGAFASAAREGVSIIAVDEAAEAVRELDAADGAESYAALQCLAPR